MFATGVQLGALGLACPGTDGVYEYEETLRRDRSAGDQDLIFDA